jgi:hypothetical protein
MCACRRRSMFPSGAITTCSLIACSSSSQNGQRYVAGRMLCARRSVHHRGLGEPLVGEASDMSTYPEHRRAGGSRTRWLVLGAVLVAIAVVVVLVVVYSGGGGNGGSGGGY